MRVANPNSPWWVRNVRGRVLGDVQERVRKIVTEAVAESYDFVTADDIREAAIDGAHEAAPEKETE